MTEQQFLIFINKAMDAGFRKCYIKKLNALLMFKGNIYFNMSGVYKYEEGRFIKLSDLTQEGLKKFTSLYDIFEETKKNNLEFTKHGQELIKKVTEVK